MDNYIEANKAAWEEAFDNRKPIDEHIAYDITSMRKGGTSHEL